MSKFSIRFKESFGHKTHQICKPIVHFIAYTTPVVSPIVADTNN